MLPKSTKRHISQAQSSHLILSHIQSRRKRPWPRPTSSKAVQLLLAASAPWGLSPCSTTMRYCHRSSPLSCTSTRSSQSALRRVYLVPQAAESTNRSLECSIHVACARIRARPAPTLPPPPAASADPVSLPRVPALRAAQQEAGGASTPAGEVPRAGRQASTGAAPHWHAASAATSLLTLPCWLPALSACLHCRGPSSSPAPCLLSAQKFEAQAARQQQKAAAEAAEAGSEQSSSSDDDEEDPEVLISQKTQAQIFETLLKIRAKDDSIYQPEAKFYSSSDEDEGEERGDGAGEHSHATVATCVSALPPSRMHLSCWRWPPAAGRSWSAVAAGICRFAPRLTYLSPAACPLVRPPVDLPSPLSQHTNTNTHTHLPWAVGSRRTQEGAANVPEGHRVSAGPAGGRHRLG